MLYLSLKLLNWLSFVHIDGWKRYNLTRFGVDRNIGGPTQASIFFHFQTLFSIIWVSFRVNLVLTQHKTSFAVSGLVDSWAINTTLFQIWMFDFDIHDIFHSFILRQLSIVNSKIFFFQTWTFEIFVEFRAFFWVFSFF